MGIKLNLSQFDMMDTVKDCVLKEDIALAIEGKGNFLTAEVNLYQGTIAQYSGLKPDCFTIFFADVSLNVTPEQFNQLATALPHPPAGLVYRTLDDAFALEDKPFWVCDMESGVFLDMSTVPLVVCNIYSCVNISATYCRENYGKTWMILTKDE